MMITYSSDHRIQSQFDSSKSIWRVHFNKSSLSMEVDFHLDGTEYIFQYPIHPVMIQHLTGLEKVIDLVMSTKLISTNSNTWP